VGEQNRLKQAGIERQNPIPVQDGFE